MTFLLFLASLAVMEYLVGKPRKKPADKIKAIDTEQKASEEPGVAPPTMPGLLALGEALEAEGRGKAPNGRPVARVHGPPVNGV